MWITLHMFPLEYMPIKVIFASQTNITIDASMSGLVL
jgi:hypothetical protein